jgi:hypothetical protein
MKYLLFVSFFFCLLTACSSFHETVSTKEAAIPVWTPGLMDTVQKNSFRIVFSTSKATISGVLLAKQIQGEWRGSIINEFGLKVLDFVATPKECTLMNAISFLDKWHIKKVIASDIQFMMEIDNPIYAIGTQANRYWTQDTLTVTYKKAKQLQRFPDGGITCKNLKHTLTYSLKKIYDTER